MRSFQRRFPHLVYGSLLLALLLSLPAQAAQVLVVSGTVTKADGTPAASGLDVAISNPTAATRLGHDVSVTEKTAAGGTYSALLVTNFVEDVAAAGDNISVAIRQGGSTLGEASVALSAADETNAKVTVNVKLSGLLVTLSRSILPGDGKATATVTATVVNRSGAAVTNDTLTATATAGTLTAFTHTAGGVYTATYTAASVATTTSARLTVTSAALSTSSVSDVSLVVASGEVGEPGVSGPVLAVSGLVTYVDGKSPVAAFENLTAEVSLRALKETQTIGSAGGGKFSVAFVSATGGVVTSGDVVTVRVLQGSTVVAEKSVIVSSSAVTAGALDLGTLASRLTQPEATSTVLAVSGQVYYADGSTILSATEGASVRVEVRGLQETQTLGNAGVGKFSIAFFNATQPVVATGDTITVVVLKGGKAVATVTSKATAAQVTAGAIDAGKIVTSLNPSTITLAVTGTVKNADGTLAASGTQIRVTNSSRPSAGVATSTIGVAGAGKFGVVFFDALGEPVAQTGDVLVFEAINAAGTSVGRSKVTLTAAHVLGASVNVEFKLTGPVSVGGLAIDVPNYIRMLQKTLATVVEAPELDESTRALIKSLLPQLVRDGSLLGIAVPVFPATLDEKPTAPVLVPDPTDLDLESFGNPLFVPLLDAANENPIGLADNSFRVPVSLVGNKLNLYVRGGTDSGISVALKPTAGASIPASMRDVTASGTFDYQFTTDEEQLLAVLPSWPGSTSNPVAGVTLYLSDSGRGGPYRTVPLTKTTFRAGSHRRTGWAVTETLNAGRVYHYYYRIKLTNPIPISTLPASFTSEWAVPDVRNIQFEDRGFPTSTDPELRRPLLDSVALRIQPIVGALVKDVEREAIRIAENAVLNDPAIQAEIANDPEVRAILLARIQSDPSLQAAIINNPAARSVIQSRLQTDATIQQQLLSDPAIKSALESNAVVRARGNQIATQVATELASDPAVVKAANDAAQATLLSGGTPAQAEAAAKAAAEAKIRELAPPIVTARLNAALPGLLGDPTVAAAILPLAAPKILPVVAPDLVPVVGNDILPLVQADIQPILIAKYGARFLNQALANVVGDPSALIARAQAELIPFGNKVTAEIQRTMEVPLVSKFTVPAAAGLWVATFDLETVGDGNYTVEVIAGTDNRLVAKPLRIDRSAGEVTSLTVAPNRGAASYIRSADGVQVATALDKSGTLGLAAKITGDAEGGVFQMLGIEKDAAKQAQRIWLPVNQTAILIASALKSAGVAADKDDAYDIALLAVVLTDPKLIAKLSVLEPDGVATFLAGYNALSASKKADVQAAADIVRRAVIGQDLVAAGAALSLNFATLQEYAGLVAALRTLTPTFPGLSGSVNMLFPPSGQYALRALPVDQFGNFGPYGSSVRIDIVPPDADVIRVSKLSIGDQNGDGNDQGPFESISVAADGKVDPAAFRIWSNTKSLATTITVQTRTAHPLSAATLQLSVDGTTWTNIGSLTSAQLASAKAGDTFTLNYTPAFAASVTTASLRVVTTNALTVVGTSVVTALSVDKNPLAIEPEVLSFTVTRDAGSTPSPDSGGERGTLIVTANTAAFTAPAILAMGIELSTDGGKTFAPLGASLGGPEGGLIIKSTPVTGAQNTVAWSAKWDTTKAKDTVENKSPEARDATKDDNPYILRIVPADAAGKTYPASKTVTVAVDNVDDVSPAAGTVIATVERQARVLTAWEPAVSADGKSIVVRAKARFTAVVAAKAATYAGGKVLLASVKADNTVDSVVGELPAAEGPEYRFEVDSTAFANGTYRLAVLAVDAAGNREAVAADAVKSVEVRNILVAKDPEVLAKTRIVKTGVFDVKRHLGMTPEDRPLAGSAVIEIDAPFADIAGLFIAAKAEDVSEEVLRAVNPSKPDAPIAAMHVPGVKAAGSDTFRFTVDTKKLPEGASVARIVLGGSPNVFVPAAPILVDNTAPALAFVAPAAGTTVGTRPYVWAAYSDASTVVQLTFGLADLKGSVVDVAFGDTEKALAGDSKGANATATRMVYSPESRLKPGPHTANVRVVDRAGNPATAAISFVVETDTTAPRISSFAPTGTTTTKRPKVTVAFSDDISGVAAAGVSIKIDGVAGSTVLKKADGTDAAAGSALLSGSAVFTPNADLKAGEYVVSAVVTDVDGNSVPAVWQFTVVEDKEKPVVTAVSPTGIVPRTDATLAVSFTDASPVTVTFRLDTEAAQQAGSRVDDSRWTRAVSGLTQRQYTVIAYLTDANGNVASVEWTFTVELDRDAPAITAHSPTGFVGTRKPTILVSYSDSGSGVKADAVTLDVDGKSVTPTAKDTSRLVYTPTSDLATGSHVVTVSVADMLGNATSVKWEFSIETTPPSITSVVPAPGGKIRGNEKERSDVIVSAFYSDNQAGIDKSSASLVVTSEGKEVAGTVAQEASAVTWRPSATLAPGVYRAAVAVADTVGNEAEHSWLFMIEDEQVIAGSSMRIVPNPFDAETALWFSLGQESDVTVRIYDFSQRFVAERHDPGLLPGVHKLALGARIADFGRGVYFAQVTIESRFGGERVVKVLKMAKVR
ncbi:hypothetical protein FJZ36_02030 [Candidatus Poribacteria bacterium]|nr:hypothetical protein [Candidatus Poribacteria bacterium]